MSYLTAAQIKQYALNAGFYGSSADKITAIALAESGGNTQAYNPNDPGGSYGLLQVNADAWGADYAKSTYGDPQAAMNAAYSISKGGTKWTDWSTYNNGTYLNYANAASAEPDTSVASTGSGSSLTMDLGSGSSTDLGISSDLSGMLGGSSSSGLVGYDVWGNTLLGSETNYGQGGQYGTLGSSSTTKKNTLDQIFAAISNYTFRGLLIFFALALLIVAGYAIVVRGDTQFLGIKRA